MCLKVYHWDPTNPLSAQGLAWQPALNKTEVNLELLIFIDLLLMAEKGFSGGICHAIYQYAKANDKYMKDYDENKEASYIKHWDVSNLYGLEMLQSLPVNNFEWIEDNSQFNKNFIKNYKEESDERHFHKTGIQYSGNIHEFYNDLLFITGTMKIEKVEGLVTNLHDKNWICFSYNKFKASIKSQIYSEESS